MAPCIVRATDLPPRRSEGGGFIIADILSAYEYNETDPFLIWHELPKKHMARGEFPGAPMHPHRGFSEVPYFKRMGETKYTRKVAGKEVDGRMGDGDVEWGMAAHGIEHGVVVDSNWSGEMHGFQLWVNLPDKNRMDPPEFQNAASASMPVFDYPKSNLKCKVLVGELCGNKSPIQPKFTEVNYFDFEMRPGGYSNPAQVSIPLVHVRRILYCYSGTLCICPQESQNVHHQPPEAGRARADGAIQPTTASAHSAPHPSAQGDEATFRKIHTGEVAMLGEHGDELLLSNMSEDCMFLLITGTPLREPCVQYGPFVMGNKQDVMQAFSDFQTGKLTEKPAKYTRYGY
ncbi:unnamed protein product [Amoebophrya sp. A120]|nr:unnamed protein product [Amoebophrya sp. A120]|eukprot:GSA120T00003815001.1